MSEPLRNIPPQQKMEFSITVTDLGKIRLKVFDRITVDDVFLHLVNKEVYRILSNKDPGADVSKHFKDFLVKERYRVR